jgi:hypothetical protein
MRRLAITSALVTTWITFLACGHKNTDSPFANGGAGGGHLFGGMGGVGAGPDDAGPDADPTLGGPCNDDGQCNDMISCTFDHCDLTLHRCRFTPDDSMCQDTAYCNGVERCSNQNGCVAGDPIGCDDDDVCTIDHCDESTHGCTHDKRDADGDGDPDIHCGGGDCDDTDPTVSSKLPEVCQNQRDDNCNTKIDEDPCSSPEHDTCLDPLDITKSGSYAMTTAGAKFDYATSCAQGPQATLRDVVAALHIPPGPPIDVQVTAHSPGPQITTALAGQCGDPASEIGCGGTFASPQGGTVARVRARSIGDPANELVLPLYVTTTAPTPVTVDVLYLAATQAPTNETCGTADPILPGVPITASIVNPTIDLGSACASPLGELVYSFTLAQASDVEVYGTSIDGEGLPTLSLRDTGCATPQDELACQTATQAHVVRHNLQPGTYFVAVSSTAPTDIAVTLEVLPPTMLASDETCTGSPILAANKTIDVDLSTHQDDINIGCLPGAVDAAYELDLANASDVLVVQRIAQQDFGAIEIASPACDVASKIVCGSGQSSPIRASRRNLAAGPYRVISESLFGAPVQMTAFVRDAVPPTLVPFADACADVQKIPSTGGFFQGNTANAAASFDSGCDQGGVPAKGAPDQILQLDLPAKKRVILNMDGSSYTTLLDVRKGPACPGVEVPMGCAVGFGQTTKSFLDLTLDAGTYFLQIDGYALDKGPWFLDVRVVDP